MGVSRVGFWQTRCPQPLAGEHFPFLLVDSVRKAA